MWTGHGYMWVVHHNWKKWLGCEDASCGPQLKEMTQMWRWIVCVLNLCPFLNIYRYANNLRLTIAFKKARIVKLQNECLTNVLKLTLLQWNLWTLWRFSWKTFYTIIMRVMILCVCLKIFSSCENVLLTWGCSCQPDGQPDGEGAATLKPTVCLIASTGPTVETEVGCSKTTAKSRLTLFMPGMFSSRNENRANCNSWVDSRPFTAMWRHTNSNVQQRLQPQFTKF